jgi:hypothetical protein
MNDLGLSKHHLTPRHQLMSSHQLFKHRRLKRLAEMSAIHSASFDQRFNYALDWCHASIKSLAVKVVVRYVFLPQLLHQERIL